MATNELSKGINGETAGMNYRDFAATWVGGRGLTSQGTQNAVPLLKHVLDPTEKFEHSHTNGAEELRKASAEPGAARDDAQP